MSEEGRGRDGPSPRRARAAPRTDPSEQNYRTGLLPRVRTSNRSSGQGCVTRARGLRAVRSTVQSRVQPLEVVLEVRRVLLPRHAVDAGSGLPLILKLKERLTESVDCDVMKERRELRAPVLPCFLTYTVERTWRANCPALRPGRVLPVRVPLGQAPYLHPLRRGRRRRTRGRRGSLFLRRWTLSFLSPCRFIPAHPLYARRSDTAGGEEPSVRSS